MCKCVHIFGGWCMNSFVCTISLFFCHPSLACCWPSLTTISRCQLDQKIMRVCISYTHLYPNKPLNHTSPFRKCKMCFWGKMQVASTLWPDIKSQKILENRIKLKRTKCSQRTKPRQHKTGQDQRGPDKEAKDSLLEEARGGWHPWAVDRPGPWTPPPQLCHVSPPHRSLRLVMWVSPHGSLL